MHKPTLFSFPHHFITNHYRDGYMRDYWLQKNLNCDYTNVNIEEFYSRLREQIVQLLIDKNIISQPIQLEDLHNHLPPELTTYGNDGLSKIGTYFYETSMKFRETLHEFIHAILYKKVLKEPFLFQSIPTFRIHCPNSKNSEFFPHFHTDLALGHPPHEMNLWIPLTEKRTGHGFYIASLEESRKIANYVEYDLSSLMNETLFRSQDYIGFCEPKLSAVETEGGEALLFDGRCFHTAMPIKHHTRISIDFRIALEKDFKESDIIYENRGRRQLKLLPDEYYHHKTAADLSF
ncbi:MAG TPA: hypothetical protein VHZ76_03410 [Gammaproteobacteria bacterium]|jgi:hypothetical protein|nr:hypothetical protein [Gammaproteobacteria bacterium]